MAPGSFNGHNFGGLHTGTGKYQNSGPYSNNGIRKTIHPTREYIVGKSVAYTGSHKDFYSSQGLIISKRGDVQKTGRSLIKVLLEDGRKTYFHKDGLVFL